MACPFRHVLGVPGEGVHAHRTLGIATVDLALTAACALAIAWARNRAARDVLMASLGWFALLMVVAFAAHVAVGVDTALTRLVRGGPATCATRAVVDDA